MNACHVGWIKVNHRQKHEGAWPRMVSFADCLHPTRPSMQVDFVAKATQISIRNRSQSTSAKWAWLLALRSETTADVFPVSMD